MQGWPCPDAYKVTVKRTGTPPLGVVWYWQGTSCGTSTALGSDSTFLSTTSGTYYIRAYDLSCGCWSSDCGSVSVTVDPLGITWSGTVSSDWTNSNNWSCGTVPGPNSNVTIPPDTTFPPSVPDGVSASVGSITLMPGAVVTVGTNSKLNVIH